MADRAQTARTWAFMNPWWRVLKAHGVWVTREADELRGLYISLAPTDARTARKTIVERCYALRDALELVFLQSIVDYSAFAKALVNQEPESWRRIAMEELLRKDGAIPCYVHARGSFREMKPESMLWIRTAISTLLTPQSLHERTQAFQDARKQLLSAADPGVDWKELKISIGTDGDEWIVELANFVRTAPPPAAGYAFCRVLLDLCIPGAGWLSDKQCEAILTCLDEADERVQLGRASLLMEYETTDSLSGDLLSAIFQRTALSNDSAGETPRVSIDTVTFAHQRPLIQLCSALMSAQGVESLELKWRSEESNWTSRRDRVRFKRWIILSLFSSLARHSIRELTLDSFFVKGRDVDDLEAFLLGTNHLGALGRTLLSKKVRGKLQQGGKDVRSNEERVSPTSRAQAFLANGTQLWFNSFATRREAVGQRKIGKLERACWADVVVDDARDEEFYEMLVPAYGLCGVRRCDAHEHRTIDHTEDVRRLASHSITSLTLNWDERSSWPNRPVENYPGLRRFLHLVGAPLIELVLSGVTNIALYLDTIWTACPRLVHLELTEISSDILRRIEDAYECGKCHLNSLTVQSIRLPSEPQDVIQLCEKLCDPEQQISRKLTKLFLGANGWLSNSFGKQELTSMVKMLDHNAKLVSFTVAVFSAPLQVYVDQLMARNDVVLPGDGAPLPVRAKLAFLSSGQGTVTTEPHASKSITSLDCDVICRIFELVATPVKRKVVVLEHRM